VTTFTAATFASALGVTRQAAQQLLRASPPSGRTIVGGNVAPTWRLCDLPERVSIRLATRARELRFDTALDLLLARLAPWQPPFPLGKIRADQVEAARLLREALQSFAAKAIASEGSIASLVDEGLAAYARSFGYPISDRHWRRLLDRTLERAAADGDVTRLEIYLPDSIRPQAPQTTPAEGRAFPTLAAALQSIAGRVIDTDARETVWGAAMVDLEAASKRGVPEKRARRQLVEFLFPACPDLSVSTTALAKTLKVKFTAWRRAEGSVTAIIDRRRTNGGHNRWEKLPEDVLDRLVARAVTHGGRIAQAWRELWLEGLLSPECYRRFCMDWTNKSRIPQSIRAQVEAAVRTLVPLHQGGRAAQAALPSIALDSSLLASGQEFSSDDQTSNHLVWLQDEDGQPVRDEKGRPVLFRPQILGSEDSASNYIAHVSILPRPTYAAVDILQHVIGMHDAMGGLPRLLRWEHGMWEKSLLVAGRDAVSWDDRIEGLRQIGVQITHATSPGAKPIELAWKNLQARTDHWHGYVGREGRHDLPEQTKRARTEVLAGRAHPAEWFMSFNEYCARYQAMVDAYNDEPQGGKLGGLSPRQSYVQRKTAGPLVYFDDRVRHLLKTNRRAYRVTKNGITIGGHQYFGSEVAPLLGKNVLAWFDSEDPSIIVLTDFNHRNPVAVPLVQRPHAASPGSAEMKAALSARAKHAAWGKTYHAKLKRLFPEEFDGRTKRPVLVDADTVKVGTEIEAARANLKSEQRQEENCRRRVTRVAEKVNVAIPNKRRGGDEESLAALRILERSGVKAINPIHSK
jgi:hypothetical protein